MCICSCSILGNPSLEIRRNWRNLTQFHLSRMKSYMHTNNYSRSMQQFVNELMNRKRSQRTDFERCSWRCPAKILLIKTVLASIRPFYQCFYSIFSCQIPAIQSKSLRLVIWLYTYHSKTLWILLSEIHVHIKSLICNALSSMYVLVKLFQRIFCSCFSFPKYWMKYKKEIRA